MEQNAIPQIEKDVAELRTMIESSADLKALIRSPLVSAGNAGKAMGAIADAAQFSVLTKNFLLTLCANRRLPEIESVLKTVDASISARRGEVQANVVSATDLSGAQKKSLEDSLSKTIGRPVAVDVKVNKDLIGGLVVTLGSLQIDDSVKSKLDRLSRAMKYNRDAA